MISAMNSTPIDSTIGECDNFFDSESESFEEKSPICAYVYLYRLGFTGLFDFTKSELNNMGIEIDNTKTSNTPFIVDGKKEDVERLYKFGSDLEEDETYDPRSDMKLVLYESDNSKKYGVLLSVDKENAYVLELPHSRSFNPEKAYTFQSIHHDTGTDSTNYDSLTTSYSSLNPSGR